MVLNDGGVTKVVKWVDTSGSAVAGPVNRCGFTNKVGGGGNNVLDEFGSILLSKRRQRKRPQPVVWQQELQKGICLTHELEITEEEVDEQRAEGTAGQD